MTSYILRRLWQMVPTMLGVVLLVFSLFHFFGNDPVQIMAGQNASAERIASLRNQLGLDQPMWTQFGIFVQQIVRFDWGTSWFTNEAVSTIFATRLPATLTIMLPILVLELVLGTAAGMAVAYVRGSLTDRVIMFTTTVALSVSFLVYIVVGQYVFGYELGWFPVQGWSQSTWTNLTTYAPLPVMLALMVSISPLTRLYRSFFLDEIGQDYVRTARAKGVSEGKVLFKHVLRNAMIPILTNVGTNLPGVFVGSFLIESYFSIPGIGRELIVAVNRSDYPVIQAATVYLAAFTMLINLVTDVLYQFVDPRVTLK